MKKVAAPTRRSTRAGKPVQISKPEKLDDSRTKSVKVAKSPATKGHVKKTGKLAMLIFFNFVSSVTVIFIIDIVLTKDWLFQSSKVLVRLSFQPMSIF